jgi:hypothetical protein
MFFSCGQQEKLQKSSGGDAASPELDGWGGEESSRDEIAQLISDLWNYEDSFAVCYRRASTVQKWLEWIEQNIELK